MDVFQNIFGSSSDGLHVFANNPFRRVNSNDETNPLPKPLREKIAAAEDRTHGGGGGVLLEVSTEKEKKMKKEKEKKKKKKKKEKEEESNQNLEQSLEETVDVPALDKRKKKKTKKSTEEEGSGLEEKDGEVSRNLKRQRIASEGGELIEKKQSNLEKKQSNLGKYDGGVAKKRRQSVPDKVSGAKRKREEDVEETYARKGLHTAQVPAEKRNLKRKGSDVGIDEALAKRPKLDDEEKLARTVFVGNLPLSMKKKALIREFSQYGQIESVRFRSVPLLETKMPRKGAIIRGQVNDAVNRINAYIVFEKEDSAKSALASNMKEFNGNHIRVDLAAVPQKVSKDKSSMMYDQSRTVFVGNVPFDVKDEEIYRLFGAGEGQDSDLDVEAVRVIRDAQTSLSKGIAYVLFKTKVGATRALSRGEFKLRERRLRVSRAKPMPNDQAKKVSRPKRAKEGGGEDRESKRAKLMHSYEGVRASKPTRGAPTKLLNTKLPKATGKSSNGNSGKANPKEKRPAVAARKAAQVNGKSAQVSSKSAPNINTGSKRKRVEKHQRGSSRAKKIRRA